MKPSEAMDVFHHAIARIGAHAGCFVNNKELKEAAEAFKALDPKPDPILQGSLIGGNVYVTEHNEFERVMYATRPVVTSITTKVPVHMLIDLNKGVVVVNSRDKQTVAAWLTRYHAICTANGKGSV